MNKYVLLFFFYFISFHISVAQPADSVGYEANSGVSDVLASDPGLFVVMMCLFVGTVCGFIVLFLIACAAFGGLVLLSITGLVTTSFWIGWYNKSYGEGLKWFLMLTFGSLGIGSGTLISIFISFHWLKAYTMPELLSGGAVIGAAIRICIALLVFKMIHVIFSFIRNKYFAEIH